MSKYRRPLEVSWFFNAHQVSQLIADAVTKKELKVIAGCGCCVFVHFRVRGKVGKPGRGPLEQFPRFRVGNKRAQEELRIFFKEYVLCKLICLVHFR